MLDDVLRRLEERAATGEYDGRTVALERPFRLPAGSAKKFGVYVLDGDKVIRVTFGDPKMEIRRDDPERRRNFRARHRCADQTDKTTAAYWSCYQWRDEAPVEEQTLEAVLRKLEEKSMQAEITPEMEAHYEARTKLHIALVQKYCQRLAERVAGLDGLVERGRVHDQSKWGEPEREPYVWITWDYKCKDDGVPSGMLDGMKERMQEATLHHILANRHHPEFHQDRKTGLLNGRDRDSAPKQIVDATKMGRLDIAEMIADWCAMSEERGNTPLEWAKKNVGVRWRFTPQQERDIYAMIDAAWGK